MFKNNTWRIPLTMALLLAAQLVGEMSYGEAPPAASASRGVGILDQRTQQHDQAAIETRAAALKQEQYQIARQLLSERPDDFEALRIMGVVHSSHGNRAEMVGCWLRCHELQPGRADVCDQLAQYSAQLEEYEEAIAYWKKTLAIDSTFPGAHRKIGSARLKMGRPEEALEALQLAIQAALEDGEAYFLIGEAHYALQDFTKAKPSYQRAVEVQPKLNPSWRSKAWYGLIKTCGRLGEREALERATQEFRRLESAGAEADQEFRRRFDDLTQMEKNVSITCIDAGKMYAQEGDFDRSEQLWRRACELKAKNSTAHELLAKLYLGQKKQAEALQHFKQLVDLHRGRADLHQQIGFLEARLGNLAAAESAFKNAIAAAPQDGAGYRSLAKFYLNTQRQPRRAQKLAEQAVELDPVADSYFVLGWSCAANALRPEAIAALQKATEMNPNNPTYRKLYEMVRKKQ